MSETETGKGQRAKGKEDASSIRQSGSDNDHWEFYKDPVGMWHWRRVAGNNRIVGSSTEGYHHRVDCVANAERNGFAEDGEPGGSLVARLAMKGSLDALRAAEAIRAVEELNKRIHAGYDFNADPDKMSEMVGRILK
jgi:uncharacterized protein YegP (UPF0339 family)